MQRGSETQATQDERPMARRNTLVDCPAAVVETRRDGLMALIRAESCALLRKGDRAGFCMLAEIHDNLRTRTYGPLS